MAKFVLVPGAWLGAWCWEAVAGHLRSLGHDVYPVTLTGLGDRVHLARPEVDLEVHIADVSNLLVCEELSGITLVGHSYAGAVIAGVADRSPERIANLVCLDTRPLRDGEAIFDSFPPEGKRQVEADAAEHGDGWKWPMPSFEQLAAAGHNLAGLGDAQLSKFRAHAAPHPLATFRQPLRRTQTGEPPYRRAAILCTAGGFTMAKLRELIAAGHPMFLELGQPGWRLYEMATGHWPMFSDPAGLANLLDAIVR